MSPREKEDLAWTIISWVVLIGCLIGVVFLG